MVRALERHTGLPEDLARNPLAVVGENAARVDQLETPAPVRGLAVNAVPRYARLVTDDRAALAQDAIEKSGLPNVGPADNGYDRQAHRLLHVPS